MNQQLISLDVLALRINEQQDKIELAWGITLERAKEAGELLIEAKRLVGHGKWLPWLETNCRVCASMAEKYVKIAKGWDVLAGGDTEHVPNLSIRDAVKLLAKPRPAKEPEPTTIDADFTEVVEVVETPAVPEPSAIDTPMELLAHLEAVFLRLPVSDRGKAVEEAIDRLYGFKDQHCSSTTTLTKLREEFPSIPARDLRKEVADFIGQWQYARIRRDDNGHEFIKTEWAEDFIRLQREHGWQPGKGLFPGLTLSLKTNSGKPPILP